MKTAVLGVVYPNVLKYLHDYFESFAKQTYKLFDMILVLDNVNHNDILKILNNFNLNYHFIIVKQKLSISEIRETGIKYIVENGYNRLVFSDSDDFFSNNRIEKSLKVLESSDFCFNDIHLVDSEKKMLIDYKYYENKSFPCMPNSIDYIIHKNFIGLSNSAINLDKISLDKLKLPKNIKAVDWYLYTFLLFSGYTGKYTDEAITYYRQDDNNIIGACKSYSFDRIIEDIKIAEVHYSNCLNEFSEAKFKDEITRLNNFKEKILFDKKYLEQYLHFVNKNSNKFFWWEHLALTIGEKEL